MIRAIIVLLLCVTPVYAQPHTYFDKFVGDVEQDIKQHGDRHGVSKQLHRYKELMYRNMVAKQGSEEWQSSWEAGQHVKSEILTKLNWTGWPLRKGPAKPEKPAKPEMPDDAKFIEAIEQTIQAGHRGAIEGNEHTDVRVLQWLLNQYQEAKLDGNLNKMSSLIERMKPYAARSYEIGTNGPQRKAAISQAEEDRKHNQLVKQRARQHKEAMKQRERQHRETMNRLEWIRRGGR